MGCGQPVDEFSADGKPSVVAWVATHRGHPRYLIFGADYQGSVCGRTDPYDSPEIASNHLGPEFASYGLLWYPLDLHDLVSTAGDVVGGAQQMYARAAKRAVCVRECPTQGTRVPTYGPFPDGSPPAASYVATTPVLRRCLPTTVPAVSARPLVAVMVAVPAPAAAGSSRQWAPPAAAASPTPGFGGAGDGARTQALEKRIYVLLFAAGMCLLAAFLWLVVLRVAAYVICLVSLLALFALLGWFGWVAYAHAPHADDPQAWYWAAYIMWGVLGVLLIVFCWCHRNLKIACEVVEEASKVIMGSRGRRVLTLPAFTAVSSVAFAGFCAWGVDARFSFGFAAPEPTRGQVVSMMYWWNVFFFLWGSSFLSDCAYMSLAVVGVFRAGARGAPLHAYNERKQLESGHPAPDQLYDDSEAG
eukprot:gene31453-55068_t